MKELMAIDELTAIDLFEKERVENERLSEISRQKKLDDNVEHCRSINNEIVEAITMSLQIKEIELSDKEKTLIAKSVLIYIVKKKIPNTKITY